ncbi:MAG: EAL domain-containing protein [Candidatus Izemoplasma sp.]|nr:EAL domain-containing protein [Candidatus Izemoplasma sp.]
MTQLRLNIVLTSIFVVIIAMVIALRLSQLTLMREIMIIVNLGIMAYLIYDLLLIKALTMHTVMLRNPYTQFPTKYELFRDMTKVSLEHKTVYAIQVQNYDEIIEACGMSFVNVIDHNIKQRLLALAKSDHIYEIRDHTYLIVNNSDVSEQAILDVFESPMQGHDENQTYPLHPKVVIVKDMAKSVSNIRNLLGFIDVALADNMNYHHPVVMLDEAFITKINTENYYKAHLHTAIQKKQIKTYFQPKLSLKEKTIVGAEALSRWVENDRTVSPAHYIYLAEATGLIVDIDLISFKDTCDLLERLKQQETLTDQFKISTNFSPITLKNINASQLETILDQHNIDPRHISIEITERVAMRYTELKDILRDIKALGIQIEMDDFSAGHASLSLLPVLGVDTVKIDHSVLPRQPFDHDDIAIYKGLVALLDSLDIVIVAEGVETTEEYLMIHDLPIDLIQGYYISHPGPLDEFVKMMASLEEFASEDDKDLNPET